MRLTISSAALAVGISLFAGQAQPVEPVTAFATSMGVSAVVSQIESSLKAIINELDATFSKQQFELRNNLVVVMQQLKIISEGLLDKSFGQLNEFEQKAFVDAKRLIDEWNRGNKNLAHELNSIAATLEETVSRLPLTSRIPYVKGSLPYYLLSGSKEPSIAFTISGSLVHEGEPSLAFGDTPCERIGKDTRSLSFTCPSSAFTAETTVTYKSGKLTTYKPRSLWQKFTGFFTGSSPEVVPYEIAVAIIPQSLGTLTGAVTATLPKQEEQSHTRNFGHTNKHCQGETRHVWTVNATSGWSIVPASVVNQSSGRSNCGANVINVSETGFQFDAYVRNSGFCGISAGGGCAPCDARGQVNAQAAYKEVRTVMTQQQVEVPPRALKWGVEASIPLPEGVSAVNFYLDKLTGERDVITKTDTRPWYDVELDMPNRRIVVRPKPLSIALGG